MKPGIYALVSLDGAPLNPADLRRLGLDAGAEIKALDPDTTAVHFLSNENGVTAFAGFLEEQEDLAAELGLPADTPVPTLAMAAVERFGAESASHMYGGWSLLHWDTRTRRLMLITSEAWRDAMYFATDGRFVAVAPSAMALGSLSWVGRTLDPEGFLLALARAGVRSAKADESIWQGIQTARPGWQETFTASGRKSLAPVQRSPLDPWKGSFEEAVEALNDLCRRIIGTQMRRAGCSAFLLSGGIDSTLLASLGASERSGGADMFCITSVSPAGSNIPDEREFSTAAADRLGLDLKFVTPPADKGAYSPAAMAFEQVERPMVQQRQYLLEALYNEARAHGATAVFDGVAGEFSITHKPPLGSLLWGPRRWRFRALLWWHDYKESGIWPEGGFHARIAPQRLNSLPPAWKEHWRKRIRNLPPHKPGQPVGIDPSVQKSVTATSYTASGVRRLMPFLDRRLIRLAASFPGEFYSHGGENRSLARAMLRGRVPEKVRTRQSSLPFSPDYRLRGRQQASLALERMDAFREAGADEWLDLAWLAKTLPQIAAGTAPIFAERQAEITCATAEFLCWLKAKN